MQLPRGRQRFNRLGDVPDQLGHIAALAVLAVDLYEQLGVAHVACLGHHGDRANWRGMVKGLADAPGAAGFFHLALQVAACHVQANGIAKDVLVRVGSQDVFTAGANGHDQLDFMVKVFGQAGVGDRPRLAGFHNDHTVCGFEEKERRLTPGETHFLGMFFVVTAHAVHAVDRKAGGGAVDRNGHHGRGRDDKLNS